MIKYCKDCANFSGNNSCFSSMNGLDLVQGQPKFRWASENRHDGRHGCGLGAKYFIPLDEISQGKKPWLLKRWFRQLTSKWQQW